ncbi:HNH endonuclease [bacterium]|nr:HNH endonuclease [bacterium]
MWKWDQGRMQYFQYDILRVMADFIVHYDFKNSDPDFIRKTTQLPFSAPATHSPWRNYSRIFKLCLLVSESNGVAVPTDVAKILSQPGVVTCDEYIHFLIEATTDPSPALSGWEKMNDSVSIRSPLCFSLKYILAKIAGLNEYITPINEIIGAYIHSGFCGDESDMDFLGLMKNRHQYSDLTRSGDPRQSRESIKFISQISYLYNDGGNIVASLSQEDAHDIFHSINPISGVRSPNGNKEIQRLANFFRDGTEHDFFEYKGTIISDVLESGFNEGSKVKKTHIVIERNAKLRGLYFKKFPSPVCNTCEMDTSKKYPWVNRVLDLHHILPLSSGTRVDSRTGTMLEDLSPICPTCHRAIHRYYDDYLKSNNKKDFDNKDEAQEIYFQAKDNITGGACYV